MPVHTLPARHRAQLTASDVSVTRGAHTVLAHVDLTVTPNARIAIIGENGRGKSTLLHVLAGTLAPDAGTVHRIGTLDLAEQEMRSGDERTVGEVVDEAIAPSVEALRALDAAAEALADGTDASADTYTSALELVDALDAWDADRRVQVALEALDAPTERTRRLSELSVGQRYRVRLACLLGADADFLLLDEPTNHLDQGGLTFLTDRLRTRSGGVVVVTHDRALLADVADTVIDLDPTADGKPLVSGGGYAGHRLQRAAERERWEQAHERQRVERAKLQDDLSAAQNRLVSGWRPEKGTNRHGRATRAGGLVQSVHRRQEALAAHAVTVPDPPQVFRFPELRTRPGATLMSCAELAVDGRLRVDASITLSHRDRLLITGPNGAGKSTLLQLMAGELQPDEGWVRVPQDVRVGYLRQESAPAAGLRACDAFDRRMEALVATGSIAAADAVSLSALGLLRSAESSKRVGELSMGQQRRLDLAIVLAARPQVLLLDEPSNHLSMTLVDELTEALAVTPAAVVVSSHDRQLLRDLEDWPRLELESLRTAGVR